jgi:hypothetical protein
MLPGYYHSGIFKKIDSVHEYNIRDRNKFHLPIIRHEFAKSSSQYKIAHFFNNIQDNSIKDKIYTHSFDGFKRYIKYKILDNYTIDCIIRGCYICNRT